MPYPISETRHHDACVIEKSIDRLSDDPAALFLYGRYGESSIRLEMTGYGVYRRDARR